MRFPLVLDVTRVAELRRIEHYAKHIAIGAAATLTDAFAALVAEWPQLKTFATGSPACRCATRARWAATSPTARRSATRCRC